ncbi:hypothetical protein IH979_02275 [Patescibacteria group bacterium]|nr:hypothetical protein [Patescibacteria group bacterium]
MPDDCSGLTYTEVLEMLESLRLAGLTRKACRQIGSDPAVARRFAAAYHSARALDDAKQRRHFVEALWRSEEMQQITLAFNKGLIVHWLPSLSLVLEHWVESDHVMIRYSPHREKYAGNLRVECFWAVSEGYLRLYRRRIIKNLPWIMPIPDLLQEWSAILQVVVEMANALSQLLQIPEDFRFYAELPEWVTTHEAAVWSLRKDLFVGKSGDIWWQPVGVYEPAMFAGENVLRRGQVF